MTFSANFQTEANHTKVYHLDRNLNQESWEADQRMPTSHECYEAICKYSSSALNRKFEIEKPSL